MQQKHREWTANVWRVLVITLWAVREIVRTAWGILRGPLMLALNILAALLVLFEEWGWRPLSRLLERLSKFGAVSAIERWIAGLPPYGALLVFALPVLVLLPLKFVAVWLLARGEWWSATGLFIGAKITSTALIARIFTLTKPALLHIAWFARAYAWFMPWKEAFFAHIRASWAWRYGRIVKTRIKLEAGKGLRRWGPVLTSRFSPQIARIRSAAVRVKQSLFGTDAA